MPDIATFMRALARDPDCIFVCWEISNSKIAEIEKTLGTETYRASQGILRILDVTDIIFNETNAWLSIDVQIDLCDQKKYVRVPEPGRTYVLKCGLLTPGNLFVEAASSNACAVPRRGISDRMDESWAMMNTAELLRLSTDALKNGGISREGLNGAGIHLGQGSGSGSIL